MPLLLLVVLVSAAWTRDKGPAVPLEHLYVHPGAAYGRGEGNAPLLLGEDNRVKSFRQPYLPIVVPPEVMKVWVPDHLNSEGDLVQGHWVFIKRESRWYIQLRDRRYRRTPAVPLSPPGPEPGKR